MMNFNPLFIGQVNTAAGTSSLGAVKLSKSSYLFSDIIKVILEDENSSLPVEGIEVNQLNENDNNTSSYSTELLSGIVLSPSTRLSKDFVELNPDTINSYSESFSEAESSPTSFELDKSELQNLLLTLTGSTSAPTVVSLAENTLPEAVTGILNMVDELQSDNSLVIEVEGLTEPLKVEISKPQQIVKEYSVSITVPSSKSNPEIEIPVIKNNSNPIDLKNVTGDVLPELHTNDGKSISFTLQEATKFANTSDHVTEPKIETESGNNILKKIKVKTASTAPEMNTKPGITADTAKNVIVNTNTQNNTIKVEKDVLTSENILPDKTKDNFATIKPEQKIKLDEKINFSPDDAESDIKIKAALKPNQFVQSTHQDLKESVFTSSTKNILVSNKLTKETTSTPIKVAEKEIATTLPKVKSESTVQKFSAEENLITDTKKAEIKIETNTAKFINSENTHKDQPVKVVKIKFENPEQVKVKDVLKTLLSNEKEIITSDKIPVDKSNENKPVSVLHRNSTKLEQNQVRINSGLNISDPVNAKTELKSNNSFIQVQENSFTKLSELEKPQLNIKPSEQKYSSGLNEKNVIVEKNLPKIESEKHVEHKADNDIQPKTEIKNKPLTNLSTDIHTDDTDKPLKLVTNSDSKNIQLQDDKNTIDLNKVEHSFNKVKFDKVNNEIDPEPQVIKQNPGTEKIEYKNPELKARIEESFEIPTKTREEKVQSETKTSDTKQEIVFTSDVENENNLSQQSHDQKENGWQNQQKEIPVAKTEVEKNVKSPADSSSKQTEESKIEVTTKVEVKENQVITKEKIVVETKQMNETFKTIKSSEIVKEISNFVKTGETKTVVFKVVPENLGKIKVSLDVAENFAKATIEVENESVKQIVQSNLETLKNSLSQNGITLSAINVTLNGNQQKGYKPVDSKRRVNDNTNENKIETAPEVLLRKDLGYNTYEYLV
ncbi:MAG: flagellar hook-length control protein FliK [Ignavibacteriales bacterium]|nr:MAG: flagellar hook-length control protein FliK [Ignavibacteriales bacterium]